MIVLASIFGNSSICINSDLRVRFADYGILVVPPWIHACILGLAWFHSKWSSDVPGLYDRVNSNLEQVTNDIASQFEDEALDEESQALLSLLSKHQRK